MSAALPETSVPTASSGAASAALPPGFRAMAMGDAYFSTLHAVYVRDLDEADRLLIALRVMPSHANLHGVAHWGMLATLADSALGIGVGKASGRQMGHVTVSLNLDYLSSARIGDWLEAHVQVKRTGARLAFAECELRVDDRIVLRANAVFAFVGRQPVALPGAEASAG